MLTIPKQVSSNQYGNCSGKRIQIRKIEEKSESLSAYLLEASASDGGSDSQARSFCRRPQQWQPLYLSHDRFSLLGIHAL